jgi:hypothetical protein
MIPDRDLEDTREPEETPEYTKEDAFNDAADYYYEMDGDR